MASKSLERVEVVQSRRRRLHRLEIRATTCISPFPSLSTSSSSSSSLTSNFPLKVRLPDWAREKGAKWISPIGNQ